MYVVNRIVRYFNTKDCLSYIICRYGYDAADDMAEPSEKIPELFGQALLKPTQTPGSYEASRSSSSTRYTSTLKKGEGDRQMTNVGHSSDIDKRLKLTRRKASNTDWIIGATYGKRYMETNTTMDAFVLAYGNDPFVQTSMLMMELVAKTWFPISLLHLASAKR